MLITVTKYNLLRLFCNHQINKYSVNIKKYIMGQPKIQMITVIISIKKVKKLAIMKVNL